MYAEGGKRIMELTQIGMKRLFLLLLLVCLCISICACSNKSAEAEKADELILAIGEVTLDNETAIIAASVYYDTLTDAQKAEVENYSILESAIITVDSLKKEAELLKKEKEYAQIYESAKGFEAKNLIDEAFAEYEKLPLDYEDVAQRKDVLGPLVGLGGTWTCDDMFSISNRGTKLRAILESIKLEIVLADDGTPKVSYSGDMTYVGYTDNIANGNAQMLYSLGGGNLFRGLNYESDGSYILGEFGMYMTGYGGLDICFSITKDGKLEVKYDGDNYGKQTIVTYTYSKS